jgi:4-diphosphocytidyl-2-C-methyl-D-erythritol kinase
VLGRRDDGYHTVETLIAFAEVADRVTVRPSNARSLALAGRFAAALAAAGGPEQNLAWCAADRFAARFGGPEWAIELDKQLPLAAGIGGGSADAAAVLRLLAERVGIAHEDDRLVAIARQLGADVPACLAGRPCLAHGIGEFLQPLERFPAVPMLLANPGVAVPTAAVFSVWTAIAHPPAMIDRRRIEAAVDAASLAEALADCRNMLQPAAIAVAPEVASVVDELEQSNGCLLARMSGSGGTCFGLFGDDGEVAAAAAALGARHPNWWIAPTRLQGSRV